MRKGVILVCCLFALWLACNAPMVEKVAPPGTLCEVHGIPLREGVVPIIYGLFKRSEDEQIAQRTLFPHANSFYNPGCNEEAPKRARVSFCPECHKAEKTWKAAWKAIRCSRSACGRIDS